MKKVFMGVAIIFSMLWPINSWAYTIYDTGGVGTYWGGTISNAGYANRDIVGEYNRFGLDSLSVEFLGNMMDVKIKGPFFDAYTAGNTYNMNPGDLFISTNGWTIGSHSSDTASTGEQWEYVVRLAPGAANLYSIGGGSIILSNIDGIQPPGNYIFRSNQEWRFTPGSNQSPIANGSWQIIGDELRFGINVSGMPISAGVVGFHFAEQCGNDVIEGGVPVPEPATLLLLGSGLIGLGGFRGLRKKFRK